MKEPKKTIAYRLEGELARLLAIKAKVFGVSPHVYARGSLTEDLLGESRVPNQCEAGL